MTIRSVLSRFRKLLRKPGLRRSIVFTDRYGLRFILHPRENAEIYLVHKGNYELLETAFVERYLQSGMTAFDIGANIGMYTMLFAKLVGPNGRVFAFEPEHRNFLRLIENIALNKFDNIIAERLAVMAEAGECVLNTFEENLNSWHSVGSPELPDPWHSGETVRPSGKQVVKAVVLDDYNASNRIANVNLLKVDVEGAELDVLKGARKLLSAGYIGVVLFEVSQPQSQAMGHDPKELFSLLHTSGYHILSFESEGAFRKQEYPLDDRYANYLAVNKTIYSAFSQSFHVNEHLA